MHASKRNTSPPWMRLAGFLLVAVLIGWFVGSIMGDRSGEEVVEDDSTTGLYRDVAGTIVRMAPDDGVVTIDHAPIEGFMPAMVMDFELADTRELTPFEPGDEIIFDLAHIDGRFQAIRLRHRDAEPAQEADYVIPENPLGSGDLVPDIELYNAAGERFRLREMQPRNKVLTFFFVRCPLQDFCPAQSQRLSQLQSHTAESENGVHLVSLSLDAEFDSAETLADYGERFGADPAQWTLAGSEDPEAIRDFANRAGARIARGNQGWDIDHALIGLRVDGDRIVDVVYGLDGIESLIRAL